MENCDILLELRHVWVFFMMSIGIITLKFRYLNKLLLKSANHAFSKVNIEIHFTMAEVCMPSQDVICKHTVAQEFLQNENQLNAMRSIFVVVIWSRIARNVPQIHLFSSSIQFSLELVWMKLENNSVNLFCFVLLTEI